ncbi:MAG TPA: hypothetical protein PKA41_16830 [Verrucomicrobiota bacterium]|nr:hypothetical protein [Verrucomicrobiota bacterium]
MKNSPHFPRYNSSMEESIQDLKSALDQRRQYAPIVPQDFTLAVEATTHDLNHRSRRCLKGRTACAVFHDPAQRLRWTQRQRQSIFRLLLQHFGQIAGSMANGNHHFPATAWRIAVEFWLGCQRLISVR